MHLVRLKLTKHRRHIMRLTAVAVLHLEAMWAKIALRCEGGSS